ncbi:MAG: hypothetical protein HIU92_08540 [Proteobacteria bacterium]|nr:hypothetical protein [Pseudomonadota bacterium]
MSQSQVATQDRMDIAAQPTGGGLPPLPRRKLSRGVLALLILLRIYVIAAIPIVGYAFVRALLATHH